MKPSFSPRAKSNLSVQAIWVGALSAPLWMFAFGMGEQIVCLLAAGVGTILSARWFLKVLGCPVEFIHLLPLSAVSLVVVMNFGFLLSWTMSSIGLNRDFVESFNALGVTYSSYAGAVFFTVLFATSLAALGQFPMLRRLEAQLIEKLIMLNRTPTNVLLGVLFVTIGIDVLALVTGVIGFRSVGLEGYQEGKIAWFLPFLHALVYFQMPLNAQLLTRVRSREKGANLAIVGTMVISIPVVFYMSFTSGRTAVVFCVAMHFIYWCLFRGRRPNLRVSMVLGVAFLVIVPQILALNNFMREQKNTSTSKFANEGGIEAVFAMTEAYQENKSARSAEKVRTMDNLSRRPLVATPLAKCIAMDGRVKSFMLGMNLRSSFIWVIPRVIYPDKVQTSAMEGLLYRYFPDRDFLKDVSDSVYMYSYTDFGWLGIIVYPLLIAGLWCASLLILSVLNSPVFSWYVFANWPVVFMLGIGEGGLIGWFSTFRDTLMYGIIFFFIEMMLRSCGIKAFAPVHPSKVGVKSRRRVAWSAR